MTSGWVWWVGSARTSGGWTVGGSASSAAHSAVPELTHWLSQGVAVKMTGHLAELWADKVVGDAPAAGGRVRSVFRAGVR